MAQSIEPLLRKIAQDNLKEIALAIDWDQQDASRYYIGEDVAENILARIGFPFENGICNEAVEKFVKEIK